jgi:branched-chain amino acid transport system substrate-binding protein
MPKYLIAIPAVVLVAVFALFSAGARSADAPYEINTILSLTGSGAFLGKDEADALHIIENSVNRTGGIGGHDVHFTIVDDQSSPQVAVQLFNQILTKKPAVVLGPSLSGACNALYPLAQQGPVLYCLSTSFNPPSGGYGFSYGITTAEKIAMNLKYFRLRKLTRIAVLTTTDATGQEGERAVRTALAAPENAGMQLVATENFNGSDISVSAQMSRIKAASPDALVAYVSGTPLGTVLHGASQVGLDVPISVSGSNFNNKQMEQFATILPKAGLYLVIEPFLYPSVATNDAMKRAATNYVNSTKLPGQTGAAQAMFSWDPANIIVAAVRAVGVNSTPDQLRKYMVGMHGWYGACGEYDFRENPHGLTGKNAVVVRYDTDKSEFRPVSRVGTAVPIPGS